MKKIILNLIAMLGIAVSALLSIPVQASTIHVPDSALYDMVTGAVDINTDTIKCGLAPSSYTYNRATHTKRSDVTEVTGTGYTAGGQTVTPTVTNDTTNHKLVITIPQVAWGPGATITAHQLFCYKSRGGAASADELVGFADFGSDLVCTNGTCTVQAVTFEWTHF